MHFSTGGVGAIIDGSVVATGTAGSMVFHTFTQVHDGGIGFWVKNNGLSEIVSCLLTIVIMDTLQQVAVKSCIERKQQLW